MKKFLIFIFYLISVSVTAQTQITTATQLQNMSLDGNYILMNDIDLSKTSFNPIGGQYGSFTGTFDGNGYTITIKNSYINSSYNYRGLFSQIGSEGIVKNLTVKGTLENRIEDPSYVGGIAGRNSGTITNCYSNVDINVSGYNNSSAKSCTTGGIAGYNSGIITFCFSYSKDIMGPKNNFGTGGIVGVLDNNATVQNCVFVGDMTDSYNTSSKSYGQICGNRYGDYNNVTDNYYLSGGNYTGLGGSAVADDGHCTALSQYEIRALARTGGVYASTINDVFKNAILSFPLNIDFSESDGIAIFNSIKGEPADVTFRRVAPKNKKCTICLPFNVPKERADNLGVFYRFSGIKSGTTDVAQMTEVTTDLQANTAYVFQPKSGYAVGPGYAGISFGEVTIANSLTPVAESGTFQFIGTYENKTWTTGDSELGKVYGFAIAGYESEGFTAGEFVLLDAGASAAPFRAYLKYSPDASARSRAPITLPNIIKVEWISSNQTTGIKSVDQKISEENVWYTLDGLKLNNTPTKKGIYVNNGKKVIIK